MAQVYGDCLGRGRLNSVLLIERPGGARFLFERIEGTLVSHTVNVGCTCTERQGFLPFPFACFVLFTIIAGGGWHVIGNCLHGT